MSEYFILKKVIKRHTNNFSMIEIQTVTCARCLIHSRLRIIWAAAQYDTLFLVNFANDRMRPVEHFGIKHYYLSTITSNFRDIGE